jgi:hypothetical protein
MREKADFFLFFLKTAVNNFHLFKLLGAVNKLREISKENLKENVSFSLFHFVTLASSPEKKNLQNFHTRKDDKTFLSALS